MAGVLVTLFRFSIELSQTLLLPDGRVGNYEALPGWLKFLLPVFGGLVLGYIFEKLPIDKRSVGIVHVLDYLRFRKQRLPFANAVVQFFCGLIAIVSGHSVDREGPGVHLGASNAALLGYKMHLSEDENYLLAAAGGAAAIAAAYNTPLAGVIFVIEVFRVRYAVNHIVPVIVAAVIGAVISRIVYGHHPAFAVPALSIGSLAELPVIMLMGSIIGILAAGFISATGITAKYTRSWRPLVAFVCAGLITGLLAQWSPAIMGVSYDAVNRIFMSSMNVQALFLLLLAKFIATTISIGVRIPGGMIGPSLILGGAVGGLVELLVQGWYPFYEGSAGFYAIIGMVAMMGATLRAPLAALVALIELTGNLHIILPGMIAVVTAEIATRALVGDSSAFTVLLKVKHEREAQAVGGDERAAEKNKDANV
ncbi:Chloride channel protein EriC [hydrothermal vent metagenome]|uniref:Chloride channel protein EriC n=1 Tax=hydrothermal vent metagenome TaxID=652676 RepID=A0A3B1BNM0_9ZZZZ